MASHCEQLLYISPIFSTKTFSRQLTATLFTRIFSNAGKIASDNVINQSVTGDMSRTLGSNTETQGPWTKHPTY